MNDWEGKKDDDKEILTDDIEEVKIGRKNLQIIIENIHKISDERYQIGDTTEIQDDKIENEEEQNDENVHIR